MTHALVLYAHGSRDPQWSKPLERIRDRIVQVAPTIQVEIAYLELQEPALEAVLARLAEADSGRAVHVMPMFLGQGGHLRRDVAERVAQAGRAFPALQIALMPSLGESTELLEAIALWIAGRVRSS